MIQPLPGAFSAVSAETLPVTVDGCGRAERRLEKLPRPGSCPAGCRVPGQQSSSCTGRYRQADDKESVMGLIAWAIR